MAQGMQQRPKRKSTSNTTRRQQQIIIDEDEEDDQYLVEEEDDEQIREHDDEYDEDEQMNDEDDISTQRQMDFEASQLTKDQSESERRRIRRDYRHLITSTEKHRQELVENVDADLLAPIQRAEELFSQVNNAGDATLDSNFLVALSDMSAQRSATMKTKTFDLQAFLTRVIAKFPGDIIEEEEYDEDGNRNAAVKTEGIDWLAFGRASSKFFFTAPRVNFMLGPSFHTPPEKKKVKPRTAKQAPTEEDKLAVMVKPADVRAEDMVKPKGETNETTINIKNVYQQLLEHEPINYWQFVINPESFSETVENCFYVAFLVKDGKVGVLDPEDENDPEMRLLHSVELEDLAEMEMETLKFTQYMVSFDMDAWEQMIQRYGIRESLIPTRPPPTM